jgi:hypothetical protein
MLNTTVGDSISFGDPINLGVEENPQTKDCVIVDINKDGKQDIVAISYRTNNSPFDFHPAVVVYKNTFCDNNCSALCANGNTAFSINANATTYQWQQNSGAGFVNINNNSIYGGTTTNKLSLNTVPTSWYGCKYRCMVNGVASADIFTIKFRNTWLGAVNDSWENPLNWACGGVPDLHTDVVIPTGPIQVNANASCNTLFLNFGVVMNVAGSAVLTVTH